MWKYVLLASAALIGLGVVLVLPKSKASAEPTTKTFVAPPWDLLDVEGKAVTSGQFKGKVVILDFWATWCPPCQAEIPGFIELQKKYADQGLVVVGVSLDRIGPAAVREFMQRHQMNYPVVMGDAKIVRDYGGIGALPTTFIINREGHLVQMHVGYADKQMFEDEIRPLL